MSFIHAIVAEIDQESRATRAVLERVPEDKLDWRPHAKSMTLGTLAWHIAFVPARVLAMLREAEFDLSKAGPSAPPRRTEEIVAGYARHLDEIRAYFQTIDDAVLREPFSLKRGEQTVRSMPKMAVVRSILLNHTYHHRGQLSVYLRLLDVPLPSIYGPTADESM